MSIKDKYLEYSNEELRIKLKTLENEYEAIKVKINTLIDRMEKLDKEYIEVRETLMKRTKGKG